MGSRCALNQLILFVSVHLRFSLATRAGGWEAVLSAFELPMAAL